MMVLLTQLDTFYLPILLPSYSHEQILVHLLCSNLLRVFFR